MAFGEDALVQLSRKLLCGYSLNTSLLALLDKPLDCRGQEAAVVMLQELSAVFTGLMESLVKLKSGGGSNGMVASPETTVTEASVDQRTPASSKCRKFRGDKVITDKITSSPLEDGYQWRKYGQKNIQNKNFERVYYRCKHSHDLGCRAKKQVQQQDNSSSGSRATYRVTYLNKHMCHRVLPNQVISDPPTSTPTDKQNNNTTMSAHVVDGNNVQSDDGIMTLALTTIIGGAPPPPPSYAASLLEVSSGLGDSPFRPAEQMTAPPLPVGAPPPPVEPILSDLAPSYAAGHAASLLEVSSGLGGSPFRPADQTAAPPFPVEANRVYLAGVGGDLPVIDDMTWEEMCSIMCGPLFSPVAAQPMEQYW